MSRTCSGSSGRSVVAKVHRHRWALRLAFPLAFLLVVVMLQLVLPRAHVRLDRTYLPPSVEAPLGTDRLGRDVARLLIDGAALAFTYGLSIVVLSALLSTGIAMSYAVAGAVGHALIRLVTLSLLAIPSGLLVLLAVLRWPASPVPLFAGIVILVMALHAERLAGEADRVWRTTSVQTARQLGVPRSRVAAFYAFPLLMPAIEVVVADAVVKFVALEGLVTFIGYRPWGERESFGSLLNLMYASVAARRGSGLLQFALLVAVVVLTLTCLLSIVRSMMRAAREGFRHV